MVSIFFQMIGHDHSPQDIPRKPGYGHDGKIWKPYTGPAAELLIWSRLRYEMIDPESNNQLAVI